MRRLTPMTLPSWSLPFVVTALILPGAAAFAAVGPQLGLAVGALTVAALLWFAASAGYDTEIEVAERPDDRFRLLVIAFAPVDGAAAIAEIERWLAAGSGLSTRHGPPQVLVVVPAAQSRLDRWASDVDRARRESAGALAVSMAALARSEIDALGRIGDADPVQAATDELRLFAADEVAFASTGDDHAAALEELRRRLDRPVRVLDLAPG